MITFKNVMIFFFSLSISVLIFSLNISGISAECEDICFEDKKDCEKFCGAKLEISSFKGKIDNFYQKESDLVGDFNASGSVGIIPWAKAFGLSNWDTGVQFCETSDGGYVIAGCTKSSGSGGYDILVLKINSSGNILWAKTFGGSGDEEANSMCKTSDGGYLVAGYTNSFGSGSSDIFVLKLDDSGNIVWAKAYGGSDIDVAKVIFETSDGKYIVAGNTTSFGEGSFDFLVLKLDTDGTVLWSKTYGQSDYEDLSSMVKLSGDGYVMLGYQLSFSSNDGNIVVVKLDSDGDILWSKLYGGNDEDRCYSIVETSDGGYTITGYTSSFGAGYKDVLVMKLTSSGNVSWAKTYGNADNEGGNSIFQTSDGGYLITGYTTLSNRGEDFFILKLDSNGNVVVKKAFGESANDRGVYCIEISGGYMILGNTYSFGEGNWDLLLLKLDENFMIGDNCSYLCLWSHSINSGSIAISNLNFQISAPQVLAVNPNVNTGLVEMHLNVICLVTGDVNEDGVIDIGDVISLSNYLSGNLEEDEIDLNSSDVNRDGSIDAVDVCLLLNRVSN